MSTTKITVERVNKVEKHPEADRLDIIQVLGYHVVVSTGTFHVGDPVVYFPPDILIPEQMADRLGVTKYLKHSVYPGDSEKTQCRVGACRIRGVPSHGFVVPSAIGAFGTDMTPVYRGKKYTPPVRHCGGDALPEDHDFHQYTNIESIQRYPERIEVGAQVVITEKRHGTNCRLGRINGEHMAGSHRVRRKPEGSIYWGPMDQVKPLIDSLDGNVIVFGEIFGPRVQDMDYGASVPMFEVFDISVDGQYLSFDWVEALAQAAGVPCVPRLYTGPHSLEEVERCTYGPVVAKVGEIKCKFKDREGCVVKTLREGVDPAGNRRILKSVSADYRNRRGGTDGE